MKPDLRISVKDHRRGKTLKILLHRLPYGSRRFWVRMNGSRWPADGNPVSIYLDRTRWNQLEPVRTQSAPPVRRPRAHLAGESRRF